MNLICPNCDFLLDVSINPYTCLNCKETYPIINNIPLLFDKKQMIKYRMSKDTPQEYYRNVASIYGKTHHVSLYGARRFLQDFENKLKPYFNTQPNILEIGSGTGFATNIINRHSKSVTITDASLEMLSINKMNHNGINAFCCATEKLPFPNETFDMVIGNNTFYLVPDKHLGAKNIARVLRKGGKLILSEMNPYNPLWPIMFAVKGHYFERSIYAIFPFQMKSYFSSIGMTIEEIDYYSYIPYFATEKLAKIEKPLQFMLGKSKLTRRFSAIRIFYVFKKSS